MVTEMIDDTLATEKLAATRTSIKNELPNMYDAFWAECDAGKYFSITIPSVPLNRFRTRNLLLRSGTTVLRISYPDFIEHAAMSLAADATAKQILDEGLANHFRFIIRNREASDAVRAYFRFLDQVAYHLFEISGRSLIRVKTPRDVSFQRLDNALKNTAVGGSRRIADAGRALVKTAKASLTVAGWTLLQNFRNVDTHRYVVGIDHIAYGFGSSTPDDVPGGRLLTVGGYSLFGAPAIRFTTLEPLLRLTMRNAKGIFAYLAQRRLLIAS